MLSWQGASQAKVGEQFKVAVYAQTGGAVASIPLKVAFDPAALQVVDVSGGDFLKGHNANALFKSNLNQASGQVSVDISQAPGQAGIGGQGSLAVITFKAIAANPEVPITLSGSALTATGDDVPITLPPPHNIELTTP
jgi:general secretion pathway protein D